MNEPMGVKQEEEACVLHDYHSPVTVINERHHPLPVAVQMAAWGEVRDRRTEVVCSTGHNSVHYAYDKVMRGEPMPKWCVGRTRDMVDAMVDLTKEAREH